MFSRNVSFKLKPRSAAEFTRILEGEIIPLLRRRRGFEMRSVSSLRNVTRQSPSACGIKKEDAEAHHPGSILRS